MKTQNFSGHVTRVSLSGNYSDLALSLLCEEAEEGEERASPRPTLEADTKKLTERDAANPVVKLWTFDAIECSIGPGPDLSQSPFRLEVPHLGREITYVPDVTNLDGFSDSGLHRINLSKSSALFTDGHPSCCLELVLGKGRNWRDALTKLFDRMYPNKWAFFIVELEQSQPSYHLLCCNAPIVTARREDTPDSTEASSQLSSPPDSVAENSNFSLWIVPVTRVFAVPPPLPAKKKVVKKVIKKRTPNEDVYDENGEKKKLASFFSSTT
uniref:Transcription initiation factor TFIID subunit 2 n=1 Tax=Angiostrongylus cantonensis TaxID=6313 RepID=A0A158P8Q0_ANGCA